MIINFTAKSFPTSSAITFDTILNLLADDCNPIYFSYPAHHQQPTLTTVYDNEILNVTFETLPLSCSNMFQAQILQRVEDNTMLLSTGILDNQGNWTQIDPL